MKTKLSYILIVLLIPGLAEAIDGEAFLITIPGFPLTLGRLLFVLSGLILIVKDRPNISKNKIYLGFLMVICGITLASFLFSDSNVFIQSLGFLILFFGSIGNVNSWGRKSLINVIDLFFILMFSYWTVKSLSTTLGSGYQPYSEFYKEGEAINHHVPGMLVSISSAYIAVRFFYTEGRLRLLGYAVFFISIITCLYIESRSNFLISLTMLLFIALRGKTGRIKQLIKIVPVLFLITLATYQIIKNNEFLFRRFTLNDMEYQKRSSGMRVAYVELGIEDFISNPLGKGIQDTRVEYKGRKLSIHNQYLTFLVGGGMISLGGLVILLYGLFRLLRVVVYTHDEMLDRDYKFLFALTSSSILFFLTLLTIEMSGILLFIMISFLFFVEKEFSALDNRANVALSEEC